VTTNAVVVETYSLLLARSRGGRRAALAFLDMVADDAYLLERIRKRDDERAIALLRAHEDKSYSLCDALSFVVMERLRIREAIAFDRHFRAYGRFTIL
jgi:predicted nucleic acid-binding protein